MKVLIFTFLFFLTCANLCIAQEEADFPSELGYRTEQENTINIQICDGIEVKHREVVSPKLGREFYCNGNLRAEGAITVVESYPVIYAQENNKEKLVTVYAPHGHWKVYFDSTASVLRSEGDFNKGEKEGIWKLYTLQGILRTELEFFGGQLKRKTKVSESGERNIVFDRSEASILVQNNATLILLLGLIPITLFRIGWNILTYNKTYDTKYVPGFQNWQKGGGTVNILSTVIFWWFIKADDNQEAVRYKRVGNWISVISVVCFASMMLVLKYFDAKF